MLLFLRISTYKLKYRNEFSQRFKYHGIENVLFTAWGKSDPIHVMNLSYDLAQLVGSKG